MPNPDNLPNDATSDSQIEVTPDAKSESSDSTSSGCLKCASVEPTTTPGDSDNGDDAVETVTFRAATLRRERAGGLRFRKNLSRLAPEELNDLRRAFQGLRDLPEADFRSYLRQGDIHRDYCDHNRESFAPWHRAYLYQFELLLQEQVEGVMLPYWDWTTTREIPVAFRDETVDGVANPLWNSTRLPGLISLLPTAQRVEQLKALPSFAAFGGTARNGMMSGRPGELELYGHNGVHVWVGGDMGQVNTAGRDPLFWFHHANVDRIWGRWQSSHPGVNPTELDFVLDPWNMTTSQTLSTAELGYEYAEDSTLLVLNSQRSAGRLRTSARLDTDLLTNGFESAQLQLHNVHYPQESFVLHVLLNQNGAAATTESLSPENPHYAGAVPFFGHGECVGGAGHCDVPSTPRSRFDLRRPHKMTPFEMVLDVTETLEVLKPTALEVSFVLTDSQGREIPAADLQMEALSIVVK